MLLFVVSVCIELQHCGRAKPSACIRADCMGAIVAMAKNMWGRHPHRRFVPKNFCNSRMSPHLHLGVWLNLHASNACSLQRKTLKCVIMQVRKSAYFQRQNAPNTVWTRGRMPGPAGGGAYSGPRLIAGLRARGHGKGKEGKTMEKGGKKMEIASYSYF